MDRLDGIKENVSLKELSTFGIGGTARFFVEADSAEVILGAVRWAEGQKVPWRVMAGGSNIVFPDEGLDGLLIRVRGGKIESRTVNDESRIIEVDAGVPLADVIREAIRRGWAGLETLSGIPGTVGGAVLGNAGAYGHAIAEAVVEVGVYDFEKKEERAVSREECGFRYRHSIFKERPWIIFKVRLGFGVGDAAVLEEKSREIIETREKKYRPGLKCPGSFFKNVLVKDVGAETLAKIDASKIIEGKIPAGHLLEAVGAKGIREGGVSIADFHGNLFVNEGGGTAADVRRLAEELKRRVREKFGIGLEEEVRYF